MREWTRIVLEHALAAFKLRDQRTWLGFLWSHLNPLLTAAVLALVFASTFGSGMTGGRYFVFVLSGVIVWSFFVTTTTAGIRSLVVRADAARNVAVGGEVFVLAEVGALALQLVFELLALFALGLIMGARLWPAVVALPLAWLLLVTTTAGLSLLVAAPAVALRDLEHLWSMVARLLFFVTPIFYPPLAAPQIGWLIGINPIARIASIVRAPLDGGWPDSGDVAFSACFACVSLLLGTAVFIRVRHWAIERA